VKNQIESIAIIPARGGSKRLPRKNIMPFAGKPMIARTIEAAKKSNVFDVVLVTTDDADIAQVAKECGADVLMRPENVSNDSSTLVDVIKHAMNNGYSHVEHLCLLLANCPLRNASDIEQSSEQFKAQKPTALLSVVNYGWTPPFRAQFMKDKRLEPVFDGWSNKKSQLFPEVVCPTGAIYWSTPNSLKNADTLYIDGIEGFHMPWHRGVDIDTLEDFELALCLHHAIEHGFKFKEI
jgi:CMP-N-acetylneuraminic acid synthetase